VYAPSVNITVTPVPLKISSKCILQIASYKVGEMGLTFQFAVIHDRE
jgi:hypothetical protein